MITSNARNTGRKAAKRKEETGIRLSRALEIMRTWALTAMPLEFIFLEDPGPIIHSGKVIDHQSGSKGEGHNGFEFLANSGMRITLDPQAWWRVRSISKASLSGIYVAPGSSQAGRGFVLRLAIPSDKDTEQKAAADELLRKWESDKALVLVSMRVGPFALHFGANVVVSKDGEFGYKSVHGDLFCTASPHECGHSEVMEIGQYACVLMRDEKTGSTFLVTEDGRDPESLFERFPVASKLKQ